MSEPEDFVVPENPDEGKLRQAVVMIHGMGEQRPLDTLFRLANVIVAEPEPRDDPTQIHPPKYYSRPTQFKDEFEARYLIARSDDEGREQADFYEYHWAPKMQGNKFTDIFSTVFRMLLRLPHRVPKGLIWLYLGFWALVVWAVCKVIVDPTIITEPPKLEDIVTPTLVTLFGVGLVGFALKILNWLLKRFLPTKIASHFVDVVRYLDTSPRSYDVRMKIRKGMVDLLHELHIARDDFGNPKYDRIVVAAHSLGAYVAYDAITYYWTRRNHEYAGVVDKDDVLKLEEAAKPLLSHYQERSFLERIGDWWKNFIGTNKAKPAEVDAFRVQQKALWQKLRENKNPWLVTDFVSVGTPMYMADKIMARNLAKFSERVRLRQLATCPPQADLGKNSIPADAVPSYSYLHDGKRVIYHAAPFAVTRWTNVWFPPWFGFLGDWFGGSLARLFGKGIKDVPVNCGSPLNLLPAVAHAHYFSFPEKRRKASADPKKPPDPITVALREAVDLEFFKGLGMSAKKKEAAEKSRARAQERADELERAQTGEVERIATAVEARVKKQD